MLLAITPLLLLLVAELPPQTSPGWDFAIGLGLGAATLMLMMSVLTARFKAFSAPFGIDIIYYFHRQVAVLILVLVLAHPLVLFYVEPLLRYQFEWPVDMVMASGTAALIAVLALVVSALARKRLRLAYENWRRFHALTAILAVIFSISHIMSVNYYTGIVSQAFVWLLLTGLWLGLTLYIRLIKPISLMAKPYAVVDVIRQQGSSWSLTVEPVAHSGFRFKPGQFAWITSNHSSFALAEHPFSFSASAEQKGQLEFTIKQLGDYSSTIKYLKPGQRVYVDGPYGVFSIDQYGAPGYGFIAGGIGIAPIISMLRTMADRHDQRPVQLMFANRTVESTIYRQQLDGLEKILNLEIVHVLAEPSTDWKGEVGMINHELLARHVSQRQKDWHYFICGPVPMMKVAERSLLKQGIAYNRLHTEIFNLV